MIDDVLRWHQRHPAHWGPTWRRLERVWNAPTPYAKTHHLKSKFNIDAKLNGGYVLMGLATLAGLSLARRQPVLLVRRWVSLIAAPLLLDDALQMFRRRPGQRTQRIPVEVDDTRRKLEQFAQRREPFGLGAIEDFAALGPLGDQAGLPQ